MRSTLQGKNNEYRITNKEVRLTKYKLRHSSFYVQYSSVLLSFLVQYSSVPPSLQLHLLADVVIVIFHLHHIALLVADKSHAFAVFPVITDTHKVVLVDTAIGVEITGINCGKVHSHKLITPGTDISKSSANLTFVVSGILFQLFS